VTPAPVKQNDIATRTEAVAYILNDNPRGHNRLVISPLCRTLIVGMAGRYHLVREDDGELRPKKDKYSNLCFAAGTMVSTPSGLRRIESLRDGELVSTPFGSKRITATGSRYADTVVLHLSNRQKIRCTPDHPFWTDAGWVEADKLTTRHRLCSEHETWKTLPLKLNRFWQQRAIRSLSSRVSAIIDMGVATIMRLVAASCIVTFGSTITGRSPAVTTFTTRMATRLIMLSAILNVSAHQLIPLCTYANSRPGPGQRLNVFGAASPIEFTRHSASGVFAQCHVKAWHGGLRALMTKAAAVLSAMKNLWPINIRPAIAVRIVVRENVPPASVYSITVDEVHCYYAQGVLAKNCDALQYLCLGLGEGRRMVGLRPIGTVTPAQIRHGRKSMRRVFA
jgi:hypothetical protein